MLSYPQFCASHARFHHSRNPIAAALFVDDLGQYLTEFRIIPLKYSPFASGALDIKDQLSVPRAKILQSGLLLCRSSFLVPPGQFSRAHFQDFSTNERGHVYFVYNPTTAQFKRIPLSNSLNQKLKIKLSKKKKIISEDECLGNELLNVCLVFDPEISPYYKIFFLSNLSDRKDSETFMLETFIYSSETDSWTAQKACVADELFSDDLRIDSYSRGVYCNGAVNFLESIGFHLCFTLMLLL
ncbi:uncharacterized protein LOC126675419 [Mercurialis annua]|uniref:uncharacterized protein LOC126675419 n=1 Tax=Mercurialis annua TaxID=3986 RepID=UPI00215F2B73|nr:uncharacterized protein LOC126675419 [Mercurialis annua]